MSLNFQNFPALALTFLALGCSGALAFVFNERNFECAPCMCPDDDTPVCVNENDKAKKFVTYKNPCEFFCTAFCYEASTKFMYCGKCDDRPLPKRGNKGDIANFTCLGFNPVEGGGGSGGGDGMDGGGSRLAPVPGGPTPIPLPSPYPGGPTPIPLPSPIPGETPIPLPSVGPGEPTPIPLPSPIPGETPIPLPSPVPGETPIPLPSVVPGKTTPIPLPGPIPDPDIKDGGDQESNDAKRKKKSVHHRYAKSYKHH